VQIGGQTGFVQDPPRRRARLLAALAALVVLAGVGLAVVWLTVGSSSDTAVAARVSSTTVPQSSTSSTTTTIVVEHQVLPAGVTEIATARPDRAQVQVRATAPPGWDSTLTPVVVPDPAVPLPPRSALDLARTPLPSVEVPIAGRTALGQGWLFTNPGLYRPPQPLTFGVVARQGDWIQVQLPVRPNGTTGWVAASDVELSSTSRRVEVSIGERRLRVIDAADAADTTATPRVVFEAPIAAGRPATPTPTGRFHVTDLVPSVDPAGPYGPLALALDGYSEVMDRFGSASVAGSPDDVAPVLALHGTNRPSSIGQALSNGCPRLFDADIVALAALAPAGTPVDIWP
jgi:lipoprotein-anchoring transpeptidase ErfK/SrfK